MSPLEYLFILDAAVVVTGGASLTATHLRATWRTAKDSRTRATSPPRRTKQYMRSP